MTPQEFIDRWKDSGGAELANSQSFLKELCTLLDVPQPEPTQTDESQNTYVFEKAVEFNNGDGTTSPGRADLHRKGCFVLESKQGAEQKAAELAQALATKTRAKKFRAGTAKRGTPAWDQAMEKARQQAKRYAEAIPDEWPPFLVIVDIGYCFDLYADFTQSGKNYVPFPDPQSYRIWLPELDDERVRQTFCSIWRDPSSLDPSRRSAKVTRELAERLARLAKSMEQEHPPDVVAQFLMRCLFTMFAEDVELGGFSKACFRGFLESRRGKLDTFVKTLSKLWEEMDTGGFSYILDGQLQQFNGGLFEDHTALPVNEDQLELLIEAAEAEWSDVEPAIFGTLLERALDPVERHKLGAHYTPRAYVERLVMPTIIEPLREQWDTAYATAVSLYEEAEQKLASAQQRSERLHDEGKVAHAKKLLKRADSDAKGLKEEAIRTVREFHDDLCNVKVLDPACGSGNFLYVSLELMKRLEGEVINTLRRFGETEIRTLTIDPHQFLGIEVNPRAAAITDLVLWIGYLQWHFRTRGKDPLNEPIIRKFHNIECRDAVLAWADMEPVFDDDGNPVTRWDGRTTKPHPVTGEEVPDDTARVQELRYIDPRKAEWPKTDYIVGNPPFAGKRGFRDEVGNGYADAIRGAYSKLPKNCDYVMYWWHAAATLVSRGSSRRFGLITTNSITQVFNQQIVNDHAISSTPVFLAYAIPDHPWIDASDGADVRIAMTVGTRELTDGLLETLVVTKGGTSTADSTALRRQVGLIQPDLTIGPDIINTEKLKANLALSAVGFQFNGQGFVVSSAQAKSLGLGTHHELETHIRRFMGTRDITKIDRGVWMIDLYGLGIEDVKQRFPAVYQWILNKVKPERDVNPRKSRRENWWIFGEALAPFRPAMANLSRMIATPITSKHRIFTFLQEAVSVDSTAVMIASTDAWLLGVLSSKAHTVWALRAGSRMGVGNDPRYNKTRCFEKFPFPGCSAATTERIRSLGEQLDAHGKQRQELHPDLTMTGMYNVLEKLRAGEELTNKERDVHEKGLVSVLKQIHDDLDAAVFDAYDWPHDLDDEEILQRLVDLNHERAAEEERGHIRWLRPEFQNPEGQQETQAELDLGETEKRPAKPAAAEIKKQKWPATLPEQVSAVRTALTEHAAPATPAEVAKYIKHARKATVEELLDTLVAVGQARQTDDGRYVA